jgi:hypothetical protein
MELACGKICFVDARGRVRWHESFEKGIKRGAGPFEGLDEQACDQLIEEFEKEPEGSELGKRLARVPVKRRLGWGKGFELGDAGAQAMTAVAASRVYCVGDHEAGEGGVVGPGELEEPWVLEHEDWCAWGDEVDVGGWEEKKSWAEWKGKRGIAVGVGEVSARLLARSAKEGVGLSYSNVYWRSMNRWLVYCEGISGCELPSDGVWLPVSQALAFEGVPRGWVRSREDFGLYLKDPTDEDRWDWLSLWRETGGVKFFENEPGVRAQVESWEMGESSAEGKRGEKGAVRL